MASTNTALSWPTPRHQRVVLLETDQGGSASSFLARTLLDDGYVVDACESAAQVLTCLNERPVDAIVVDLTSSGRDGAELCTRIRTDPSLARLPLLALVEQGGAKIGAHVDVVLVDPVGAGELLVGVERALLRGERRELSVRLDETERLCMLGTLAASVGHELNNPLAFALGNFDLANEALASLTVGLDELTRDGARSRDAAQSLSHRLDRVLACFQDGRAGLARVRAMVADLATLTRKPAAKHRRVDVRRVLESSLSMAKGELADRAVLTCEYDTVSGVMGDGPRLGQLFVNLLINAAQSIPAGQASSNRIHVALYEDDGFVVVEIEDTGGGMSKTHLSRIFEPFFTTKAERGTGLGLVICRNIVEAHGGELEVESELGRGSRFRVRITAARDDA